MGVFDGIKSSVGSFVDANVHVVGSGLDMVGLHGAAHTVDTFGDHIADDLGAGVGELSLGQTDDPKELVHGDTKAINESAQHLHKFSAAFEETAGGLSRLDSDHWQGQAADAFRHTMSPQPTAWRVTADNCEAAAKALEAFTHTIDWAQGQARQAIDAYHQAKKASEDARNAYNHQVEQYKNAVDGYNRAVSAGQNPGAQPTSPGEFQDPGEAGLKHAEDLLREARRQRESAAHTAEQALKAATSAAPAEPGFWQRLGNDLVDAPEIAAVSLLHLDGGVVKAAADLVKFGRGLNPFDAYNLTHPAQYLDHLNTTAAGLVQTANHPTALLSAIVGSGWGSDPVEAAGKCIFNLGSGMATGGGADAALVTERVVADAGEAAAERGGIATGEKAVAAAAKPPPIETLPLPPKPEPIHQPSFGLPREEPATPDYSLPDWYHSGSKPAGAVHAHLDTAADTTFDSSHPGIDAPEDGSAAHTHGAEAAGDTSYGVHDPAVSQTLDHTHLDHSLHAPEAGTGQLPDSGSHPAPADWAKLPVNQQMELAQGDLSGGARVFNSNVDAEAYGAKHWNDYAENLPQERFDAVRDYTREHSENGGPTYHEINGYLRTGKGETHDVLGHIEEMDKALKGNPLPEDIVVSRGTGLGHINMDPPDMAGQVFDEKSYTSSSLGDAVDAFKGNDAVLHLRVPEGTPALWVEKVSVFGKGERELLLCRGLKWHADRVIKDESGQWHIYGQVMPQ